MVGTLIALQLSPLSNGAGCPKVLFLISTCFTFSYIHAHIHRARIVRDEMHFAKTNLEKNNVRK